MNGRLDPVAGRGLPDPELRMGLRHKLRQWSRERRAARNVRRELDALHRASSDARPVEGPLRAEGIVFSKDRPLQLFALLSSYAELVQDPPPLHLLYRVSDAAYEAAYGEVFRTSPAPLGRVVRERSFREDLLGLIGAVEAQRLFFLVDDIVFVRAVDLGPLLSLDPARFVPSLRLGANLSRCYTDGQALPLPPFLDGVVAHGDLLCWRWKDGTRDWTYPLSVDGHVFSTLEMRALARSVPFSAPNSFEAALQDHLPRFADRLGVCHRQARLLNVPCNKVQEEFSNRSGAIDAAALLEVWRSGRRLDHRSLYGITNESVHQEVELAFAPRDGAHAAGRG